MLAERAAFQVGYESLTQFAASTTECLELRRYAISQLYVKCLPFTGREHNKRGL
jgi:hypothetical protein